MGGGSATVFPPYTSTLVDGLREALGGGAEVLHAAGGRVTGRLPVAARDLLTHPDAGTPGVDVRFFAADGTPLGGQHRLAASMFWWGPIEDGVSAGGRRRASSCGPGCGCRNRDAMSWAPRASGTSS